MLWLWIKSWFTCIHSPSQLSVDRIVEKLDEDLDPETMDFEKWKSECTCKCGEKVTFNFWYSKEYRSNSFDDDGYMIPEVDRKIKI